MSALTARVIADRGTLDSIVPAWNALLADGATAALFSTPEWQLSWLDAMPDVSPRCIAIWNDAGELRALLPLAVRSRRVGPLSLRTLELGGEAIACGDHLGLVVHAAEVADAWSVAAPLVRSCAADVDLVRFASIDESEAAAVEAALGGNAGWRAGEQRTDIAPRMPLPCGGGDVLELFRPPRRARLRYYERHFSSSHPSGVFALNDARMSLDAALDALDLLHGSRWESRGESGVLVDTTFTSFVRRFARIAHERGWLRLYQTIVEDRVVATMIVIHWRDTASAWLLGWDPAYGKWNVSELLFLHSMREAAREGLRTYDFLRGREPYKFRFPVESLVLLTKQWTLTVRGRVAVEVDHAGERVLASARRWRTRAERVAQKMKTQRQAPKTPKTPQDTE